jgi:hypothetical protein
MPLVAIRGQLGVRAPEIGKQVADRLCVHYVDREIMADIAARLHRTKEGIAGKDK